MTMPTTPPRTMMTMPAQKPSGSAITMKAPETQKTDEGDDEPVQAAGV